MCKDAWKFVTEDGRHFPEFVAQDPTRSLLVLDFDGTLAHMDPDPEAVQMVESSAAALATLADKGAQIAIISGRPVEALLRLGKLRGRRGFERAILLGQYGVERLDLGTGRSRQPEVPETIRHAKFDLEELVSRLPGAHLEDKGRALAVHTRRMENPDSAFQELKRPVLSIASQYGLTVEPGRLVWELRSQSTSKGDALNELIQEFHPAAVMMAGDDLGDLAAFDVLASMRTELATCAVVSESEEQRELAERADVLADGPDGVASWLAYLARTLR